MSVTYGYAAPLAARYWGPNGWTDADVRGTVQSVSVNGRSTWGYRVECHRCGAVEENHAGSSVSYEDGPVRFAMAHRACDPADVFGVSTVNCGHPLTGSSRANRARMAKTAHIYGYGSGDTGVMHGPTQWLEPAPPASVYTHERMHLFTPVDVMPGQTGMEL